jgi:hypothetical protein
LRYKVSQLDTNQTFAAKAMLSRSGNLVDVICRLRRQLVLPEQICAGLYWCRHERHITSTRFPDLDSIAFAAKVWLVSS